MIKSKKYLILAVALIAIAATAAYWGKYLCRNCSDNMNPADARNFVSQYVNNYVPIWRADDTFQICNGRNCTTYKSIGPGTSFSFTALAPDNGIGYVTEGYYSQSGGGGGGDPFPPQNPPIFGGGGGGGVVIVEPTIDCSQPGTWEYIHWCVGVP